MAQFSNDIPLPQTKDEHIEQMQKEINYLSSKIDRLEEENKQLRNFIKSAMPTLEAVSQMTQDYTKE